MTLPPTRRLYLENEYGFEVEATLLEVRGNSVACDRTCFYPGGGGQPPDKGEIQLENGMVLEIDSAFTDEGAVIWHVLLAPPPELTRGEKVRLVLNPAHRLALMRYHTALHVLNTIALRDYDAWITGVQIGPDYSRIDFKLESISASITVELESRTNAVLAEGHPVRAYYLSEKEFRGRPDLLRTLTVKPPIQDGSVRVIEILGFDAQACGGTHVRSTAEVGQLSIFKIENKGRLNKRVYVRLSSNMLS